MNIAIIGYGRMGKEIEQIALNRGHKVLLKIDEDNVSTVNKDDFKNVDVAIEFTVPESAFSNINLCYKYNIPVVSGTTGWLNKFDIIIDKCKKENQTFFYASNYSIGVNLFFKLNENLAKLMNNFSDYNVEVEETHHTEKVDTPSGTAITIADSLIQNIARKNKWIEENENSTNSIAVKSYREGNVFGNHKIIYESEFDKIMIEHDAKSRKGFALGAVLAAEFIANKKGYYTMNDLLKF
ncbi:MAG: 4-hydroxy-tetrahydrodipicolinate reductase [Bacteroidales bacterium]|jgi:4-hydroxy-tetrahydrodipicolinate reductase|nr:4-hydroxy-tetrahydrodipicolinate reductase [Bacteroidales bacterium]